METETTTTATTTQPVRRGNGTAVHIGVAWTDGKLIGTRCALDVNYAGRQSLRLTRMPEGTPVTCKSCAGDKAAPAAATAPAPETCATHPAGTVYSVRTVKAGTKTTYTCGCHHLER